MPEEKNNLYEALYELAKRKMEHRDFSAAANILTKLLNRCPDHEAFLFQTAYAMAMLDQCGIAISLLKHVLDINPKNAQAWLNMGCSYRNEGYSDEAMKAFLKSRELQGNTPEVLENIAAIHQERGALKKAITYYREAIKQAPDVASIRWNLALTLLKAKQYEEGWNLFEYRKQQPSFDNRDTVQAHAWHGETLTENDHLYVHGEQGVGDEIHFLSLFDNVVQRVPRITLEVNRKVVPLAKNSWRGTTVISEAPKEPTTEYTHKIALGSLPNIFLTGGQKPTGQPFLADSPLIRHYEEELAKLGPRPWVALAWTGGMKRTDVLGRSMNINYFQPLRDRFTCVSGQYEDNNPMLTREREEAGLVAIDTECIGASLEHQAALFAAVDVVVTVPQTAFHVAGAVGTRCYVLLPEHPDWRFGTHGTVMPWYSTVKLIRGEGVARPYQIQKVLEAIENEFNYTDLQGTQLQAALG